MTQRYQANIDSLENLQYVASVVDGFNQDRFLAALMGKKFISKAELKQMCLDIAEINIKLERQFENLSEFGRTFNDKFVTRNNSYFSSALTLLSKVRSGMSRLKTIYKRFAPQNEADMHKVNREVTTLDLYDRSAMANATYTLPLLSMEHFTPEVGELYDIMKKFMDLMSNSLSFCQDILEEEEHIRQNPDACLLRYEWLKEEQFIALQKLIQTIDLTSKEFLNENNPALILRKNTKDVTQFAKDGFHNLPLPDTLVLIAKEIKEEVLRGDFTETELVLFNQDRDLINKVRHIIQHFDSYLPKTTKRKQIPASHVACLMWWCNIPLKKNLAFVKYFKETYKAAQGTLNPPSNPAVNQAKRTDWKGIPEFESLMSEWKNVEFA